jgi:hypothetical protein
MVIYEIIKEKWDAFSYNSNVHFNLKTKKLESVNKLDESDEITMEDFGEEIGMTLPGFKI